MQKDSELLEVLRPIQDPELFISIVELGLIYGVEKNDPENITVELTLTSPGCPIGPQIMAQIQQTLLEKVEGVKNVDVKLIWDPPWDPKVNCSEEAKMQLGIF
ncbi:MAG: DUF59 domain-containing protein [Deltaproteobacteria bacterium]|nr:DUF59 domain-containing protein [Deltaproteobacteria bacterium]MBI3017913.1 DUF59 domain-containing protein [Deltaproteobacteria bacterium]